MMEDDEIQYDIKVVNAFKSYGENKIINGLHMNVQSGSIYGLLGASGCGKSTILQCILGKITLDSGTINLRVNQLRDVGYMPQDLCLEDALSIKELFEYYGTLYGMTKQQIKCRTENLTKFLQFPDLNKFIKNISGGQGRRVSLAVSILHDPKVIILDEPTVGIDPLLRERVWNEFLRMVEQSEKTIIITTHYIEEATKANCVGFMRNGVIVEEGVPQNILTKYETNSLESAFLTLCCKREEHIASNNPQNIYQKETVQAQNNHFTQHASLINFIRIKALIRKNVKVFSRDYMLMMNMFLLLIFQAFNLCLSIGVNMEDMVIAVKNDEISLLDCSFSKMYECILVEASNQKMSCDVINYLLSHNYKIKEVKDFNEGETMVNYYMSSAFLYFPQNYTGDLSLYVGEDRLNYDLGSPMYVHFANENFVMKNQIVRDVTNSVKHVTEKILESCSNNPKALSVPLDFNVIQGKEVKSLLNYGTALFLASIGFYITGTFSVSLMLTEKSDGLFGRSMFAGVTILDLLISLFCIDTVLYIIQMIPPIFIVYVCFSNPLLISGNLLAYFFILLLLGWIGFFYGISIAGLFSSKMGAVSAMNGLFVSFFLLSGMIWPIEGQFVWLRMMSELLPTTIGGHTMNAIALKGWSWDHPSVVYGISILVLQLILIILFLAGLNKIKKITWIINK